MGVSTVRTPASQRRPFGFEKVVDESPGEPARSLFDMGFGFFEEFSGDIRRENETSNDDDVEEEENCGGVEENKVFWETQNQILQGTLCRSSSLESRIRKGTKEALREVQSTGTVCVCQRPVSGGCRSCLMKEISCRLGNSGYDSAVCKSKWRSSPDIPSGEHTFLDVLDNSNPRKGEVRVIIELNFRAEFEMARASEEYNRLIENLPEVFVGKVERLSTLIKILCSAAKKCMKEKKMHMGPWRKHKYMQAKWLSSSFQRSTTSTKIDSAHYRNEISKQRASILTFDLFEAMPNLHSTAVQVV